MKCTGSVGARRRPLYRFLLFLVVLTVIAVGQPAVVVAQPVGGAANSLLEVAGEQFFIVAGEQGVVRVLQRTVVQNGGPSPVGSVEVPVPSGVRLLEPAEGWGPMNPGASGLQDTRPIAPGEVREYRIVYELFMGSRPVALRRPLPYPVREIALWVEDGTLALTGLHLRDLGTETLGGSSFRVYGMPATVPHEAWQVVVRPGPQWTGGSQRSLPDLSRFGERHGDPLAGLRERAEEMPWLLPSALVAAGGLLVWGRRRGRARTRAAVAELEAAVVRLDVAYRAGELDEQVYRSRRRELMERLRRERLGRPEQSRTGRRERRESVSGGPAAMGGTGSEPDGHGN